LILSILGFSIFSTSVSKHYANTKVEKKSITRNQEIGAHFVRYLLRYSE